MKKFLNILLFVGLTAGMLPNTLYAFDETERQSIEQEMSKCPELKILNNSIEIVVSDDKDHTVAVYALTGQVIKNIVVSEGSTSIDLNSGYYIVKIDDTAKRVIIR